MLEIFHYIGSSAVLVLIAFIIVDTKDNKNLNKSTLISRLVIITLLMLVLIRT